MERRRERAALGSPVPMVPRAACGPGLKRRSEHESRDPHVQTQIVEVASPRHAYDDPAAGPLDNEPASAERVVTSRGNPCDRNWPGRCVALDVPREAERVVSAAAVGVLRGTAAVVGARRLTTRAATRMELRHETVAMCEALVETSNASA